MQCKFSSQKKYAYYENRFEPVKKRRKNFIVAGAEQLRFLVLPHDHPLNHCKADNGRRNRFPFDFLANLCRLNLAKDRRGCLPKCLWWLLELISKLSIKAQPGTVPRQHFKITNELLAVENWCFIWIARSETNIDRWNSDIVYFGII